MGKLGVCSLGLGKLPEIWRFPYNISATSEASNFNFIGMLLGFAKAHHIKSHTEEKWTWPYAIGDPQNCGFLLIFVQGLKLATFNLECRWGWPRPTIKTTTRRKSGRNLWLRKLPNIWEYPIIFLQRPLCRLIVIGASCFLPSYYLRLL